jgi:hypothetical protein
MRNTWKGMLLGALGGAAVGLALESIERAARGANSAAQATVRGANATPEAAARAGGRARQRLVILAQEGAGLAARAARKAADRAAERNGVHH